jgi:hypothetical protein
VVFNTTKKTIEIYRSHELYDLPTGLRDRLHSAKKAAESESFAPTALSRYAHSRFPCPH